MQDAAATCVALQVGGSRAAALLRLVEGALGWQVVAPDDVVLPPRCRIVDVAAAGPEQVGGPVGGPPLPRVLVVAEDDGPAAAAAAARGAAAVIGPDPTAEQIRAAVDGLGEASTAVAPWRTIGGSAGGVGCTTVASAVAGLHAWEHGPTLLVASGPCHQAGAPEVAPADLGAPATWAAAARATAVEDLRVVRWREHLRPQLPGAVGGPPSVVELGPVDPGEVPLDVLVVRPDTAGLAAVEAALGAPAVVVVGRGPVPPGRLRAVATGPVVEVAWSARVAAAAHAGRLPAALPGRWLRDLLPLAEGRDARMSPDGLAVLA